MGKYDEGTVVRELTKNPAVSINSVGKNKSISIVKGTNLIGNGYWGRIDFLTKYCGYTFSYIDVDEQRATKLAEVEAKRVAKKAAIAEKRKGKVDLISSVKANLSKVKLGRK